jgi:hypothetical protein
MSTDAKTTQENVIFDAPLSPPEGQSELPTAEKVTLDGVEHPNGDEAIDKVDQPTPKRKFEHTINLDVEDMEGLQNVALTPVGENPNKQLQGDSDASPASPPLVLKSIPSTPMGDISFTNGDVEEVHVYANSIEHICLKLSPTGFYTFTRTSLRGR